MKILLTGGTGLIGNAVLRRLRAADHEVVAVVRSADSAARVAEAGATALEGDLLDTAWLTEQLREVDGAIHTAAGGDAGDAALNDSVIDAALTAFAGTEKPFVHTGGIWTHGSGEALTEDSPQSPPTITSWRLAGEQRVLDADLRTSVVRPGIVYGHGAGIPVPTLVDAPQDDSGARVLVGDGSQHWTTVHTDDLADLYLLVLEQGRGAYLGATTENPTVRSLGEALGPVVPGSREEAESRFGAAFAEALLLDQQVAASRGSELGWTPSRPSLGSLLVDGYRADL